MLQFRILSFLLGALFAFGCGPPPIVGPQPGAAIQGLNLSGKWYSDQFQDMKIAQTANKVSGSYAGKGPEHKGTFRGSIQGDLIRIDWMQPGSPVSAVMPLRGKAWLRILKNGTFLDGRWGYDGSAENGGRWAAEKSQYQ